MSRYVEEYSDTRYVPTPSHVCDPQDFTVPVADSLWISTHLETYRGLVRQFAMTLQTADGKHIARIDTDHSVVHRHQFYRDGSQDRPPHFIERIPAGLDGAKTVDKLYGEAADIMYEQAGEMLRRWAQ